MSQRDFLRAFDAFAIGECFFNAGIADRALYIGPERPPGAVGVGCMVMVDRAARDAGDDLAPVSAYSTTVTLQHSEVGKPKLQAEVRILDDEGMPTGDVYQLVRRVSYDESSSKFEVEHVPA